jgi:hypothetical protein
MSRSHALCSALLSCLAIAGLIAPGPWMPVAHAQRPIYPLLEPPADAPPSEPAQPIVLGPDEVELIGGGFVRGTLVEVTPEVRVVIVPDGSNERREIPWSEIADVARGKHAADATPAWPKEQPAPARAETSDESDLGRPRVHVELTRPRTVKLYEVDSEIVASGYNTSMYGIQYRSLCAAPCDRTIDGTRGQDFFLATGDSGVLTASRRFSLVDHRGEVTLRVKPGSAGLRIVGAILLGIGIGCTIGGAVFAALKSTRTIGYVFLGIGVPSLAAGIPMTIFGRTRYELYDRDQREDDGR